MKAELINSFQLRPFTKCYFLPLITTVKAHEPQSFKAIRKNHLLQCSAKMKRTNSQNADITLPAERKSTKTFAFRKAKIADPTNTIHNRKLINMALMKARSWLLVKENSTAKGSGRQFTATGKAKASETRHCLRQRNGRQSAASRPAIIPNEFQLAALPECKSHKLETVPKTRFTQRRYADRQSEGLEAQAFMECPRANSGQRGIPVKRNLFQLRGTRKAFVADDFDGAWNEDVKQCFGPVEQTFRQFCDDDVCTKCDVPKSEAPEKAPLRNATQTIGKLRSRSKLAITVLESDPRGYAAQLDGSHFSESLNNNQETRYLDIKWAD
jgi:hypothetical protein